MVIKLAEIRALRSRDSGYTYIKTVIFATKIVEQEMSVDLPARQRGFLRYISTQSTFSIGMSICLSELEQCLHAQETFVNATKCK